MWQRCFCSAYYLIKIIIWKNVHIYHESFILSIDTQSESYHRIFVCISLIFPLLFIEKSSDYILYFLLA